MTCELLRVRVHATSHVGPSPTTGTDVVALGSGLPAGGFKVVDYCRVGNDDGLDSTSTISVDSSKTMASTVKEACWRLKEPRHTY